MCTTYDFVADLNSYWQHNAAIQLAIASLDRAGIQVNQKFISLKAEAGSGYVKKNWLASEMEDVQSISITNQNDNIGWGGLYLQYLEEMDQVQASGDENVMILKEIFKEVSEGNTTKLVPQSDAEFKVGDILVTRLVIKVDRDLEYVHLKDLRASGTEPINVLSGYRWTSGLGYYESTRDAATHFFMDYLSKGNYVFEYKTRISHSGVYDGGIASLTCMYAPEFSSHSSSQKLHVN